MSQAQAAATDSPRQNRKQRRLAEKQARRARKAGGADLSLLEAADKHHRAGRIRDAEILYRQVLDKTPQDLIALSQLGALCAQTQRHDEAAALLQQALTVDRTHGPSHMNLGVIHAAQGRTEAADASFREGARHAPEDAETQKNYGAWCHQRGRLKEAAEALETGLKLAPRDPARQSLLGQAYGQMGENEKARQRFEQALALFPDNVELHAHLGALLAAGNQPEAALPHLARGMAHMTQSRRYQALFVEAVGEAGPEVYGPDLEPAFMACLDADLIEAQRLAASLGSFLWLKFMKGAEVQDGAADRERRVHLMGILADPALIRLLQELVNVNVGLEALLVPLRRTLLMKIPELSAIPLEILRFIASFAMQCHANSYVFPTSDEEKAAVQRLAAVLEKRIAEGAAPDPSFETAMGLMAMYQPIHRLQGFERLLEHPEEAWSAAIQPLVRRALLEPAEERTLKAGVERYGAIEDEVSQAVRSQYEDNPYPRWISLPKTEHGPLKALIRAGSVDFPLPEGIDDGLTCLIAGCGTGKHPISVALVLRHAEVTAVDLSLSSLAYAKRMAARYGLDNLSFRHGDLLDIGALGRRFRMIESMGVLHHMEQPERGLDSLLGVLEPGGLLHLGLYSATARQAIQQARMRIQELGLESTADAIREFRRRIVAGEEPAFQELAGISDFFDLDSFRDLVFHVQEHQFTIPEIADLLDRKGLTFLGFSGLSRSRWRAFNERFPQPEARRDLDAWQRFESDNPTTFRGMYKFWCRPCDASERHADALHSGETST